MQHEALSAMAMKNKAKLLVTLNIINRHVFKQSLLKELAFIQERQYFCKKGARSFYCIQAFLFKLIAFFLYFVLR